MCSGFSARRLSASAVLGVLVAASVLASACGGQQASSRADVLEAPPLVDVPVGPWPGPQEYEEGPENPFAEDVDALAEGRRYFVWYNCAGCHGDHGGGGMGPSLRDHVWLYGASHARVANSIAEGRAYGMPAWRKMLTDAQIWQITAYIKSMRTEKEPQPPL